MTIARSIARPIASPIASRTPIIGGGGGVPFDFYVDSVNGSDSNDGLTAATAFATIGAVQTAALAFGNGVRIGLAAGSHWRESLRMSAIRQCVISGYGNMNLGLPRIDATNVYAGTWLSSVDRADANTATYSASFVQPNNFMHMAVFENGTRLNYAASAALVNSTPGTFFVSATLGGDGTTSAGTHVIFIHPRGSTNPNSDGKIYEVTAREVCIELASDGSLSENTTIRLVHAHAAGGQIGGIRVRGQALIDQCLTTDHVKHQAIIGWGEYRKCVSLRNMLDARTATIELEFFVDTAPGRTALWNKCVVWSLATTLQNTVSAFSGHVGGAGTPWDSVECIDCHAQNCTTGFSTMLAGQSSVTRLQATNCNVGVFDAATAGTLQVTDYFSLYNAVVSSDASAIRTARNVIVEGLRVYTGPELTSSLITQVRTFPEGNRSITVRKSACFFDSPDNANWISPGGSSTSAITMSDTLIESGSSGATRLAVLGSFSTALTYDMQRNAYGTTNRLDFRVNNVLYLGAVNYLNAAVTNETGSVAVATMGFTDPANGNFNPTASGLPAGAGLERPNISYVPMSTNVIDATNWIISP
jgi:hypothetical protein